MNTNRLILASIVCNVGSLIGAMVMAGQNDYYYTITSSYGYYWFISIMSLLVSAGGYYYHVMGNEQIDEKIKHQYAIYVMAGVAAFFTLSWFGEAVSFASLSRECTQLKDGLNSAEFSYYTGQRFSCDGGIIATLFAFLSLGVWGVTSYIVGRVVYNKLWGTPAESPIELTPTPAPNPVFTIGDEFDTDIEMSTPRRQREYSWSSQRSVPVELTVPTEAVTAPPAIDSGANAAAAFTSVVTE